MKTRTIELGVLVLVVIFSTWAYLGKVYGWHDGFVFSPTVSLSIMLLLTASLVTRTRLLGVGGMTTFRARRGGGFDAFGSGRRWVALIGSTV